MPNIYSERPGRDVLGHSLSAIFEGGAQGAIMGSQAKDKRDMFDREMKLKEAELDAKKLTLLSAAHETAATDPKAQIAYENAKGPTEDVLDANGSWVAWKPKVGGGPGRIERTANENREQVFGISQDKYNLEKQKYFVDADNKAADNATTVLLKNPTYPFLDKAAQERMYTDELTYQKTRNSATRDFLAKEIDNYKGTLVDFNKKMSEINTKVAKEYADFLIEKKKNPDAVFQPSIDIKSVNFWAEKIADRLEKKELVAKEGITGALKRIITLQPQIEVPAYPRAE